MIRRFHLNVVRRYEERRPTNDDKKSAGQEVSDDVVSHLPLHVQLESGHRVVSGLLRHVVTLVPHQLGHPNLSKTKQN